MLLLKLSSFKPMHFFLNNKEWRLKVLDVTASTNDDVRIAAELGESEGLVIQARQQQSGRGRHGRVWQSPPGNLYMSILLKPKSSVTPANAGVSSEELNNLSAWDARIRGHDGSYSNRYSTNYGWYGFIAALAIRAAILQFAPVANVTLKWPNDVLVDDKKISGILLEVSRDSLILGIGMNVGVMPEAPLYPATTLKEYNINATVDEVRDALLSQLIDELRRFEEGGSTLLRTRWLAHAKRGEMSVKLPNETVQGLFQDIDENGCLRLVTAIGESRTISTGDVFLVKK